MVKNAAHVESEHERLSLFAPTIASFAARRRWTSGSKKNKKIVDDGDEMADEE